MAKKSTKLTLKNSKDFSVHLPNAKITQEEEAKRLSNLKSLLAKARNLAAARP